MYGLFNFLEQLLLAAIILLPVLFYYLHKRNVLKTQKEILLKEIEKGGIVDPEMLAKSLTNPESEEQWLQHNLRCGIIFSIAGVVISVATIVFYVYLSGVAEKHADGTYVGEWIPITLVVTVVLVVAAIVLGVGVAFLVSYFNQKKKMQKTA